MVRTGQTVVRIAAGLAACLCIHLAAGLLHAQSLVIEGGDLVLRVTAGPDGSLEPATDSNTILWYLRQGGRTTKVTVESIVNDPSFSLEVAATAVGDGASASAVTLREGMPPMDLITDIPQRGGGPPDGLRPPGVGTGPPWWSNCRLTYTARADIGDGSSSDVGDDVHTVVYTLVEQ